MINRILDRARAEMFDLKLHKSSFHKGFNDGVHTVMKIVREEADKVGWIPVERELPKDSRDVWVTIRTTSGDCYTTDSFYDVNLEIWRVGKLAEVIAWQPKQIPPAPYQKGE